MYPTRYHISFIIALNSIIQVQSKPPQTFWRNSAENVFAPDSRRNKYSCQLFILVLISLNKKRTRLYLIATKSWGGWHYSYCTKLYSTRSLKNSAKRQDNRGMAPKRKIIHFTFEHNFTFLGTIDSNVNAVLLINIITVYYTSTSCQSYLFVTHSSIS